ncbi:MAG TPA: ribonuclease Z [Longimicrobiales bacterium]|nr:ribonuclease Z [Longimicrobiales bacterium]
MNAADASATVTILGAGTLMPDAGRTSAAHHLRVGGASLLLDCGAGTVHGFARHGVAWRDLTHVAITHYHNDHIGDLPAMLFALKHGVGGQRAEPLTMIGPRGFQTRLERLASAFGDHVLDPGFPVRVIEVDPGRAYEAPDDSLRIECLRTPHTDESLAYRVEGTWGTLGYTGDTGPSDEVASFLAGCDALIAECTLPDARAVDTHLTPRSLAELAGLARPALLIVVHVTPYHTPADAVRRVSERYEGRVVAAADGLRVRLGSDGPDVDPLPSGL